MSKFKINEKVVSIETGKVGVVRVRDVQHNGKTTTVKYMVDFGGGMESWVIMTKNQLKRLAKTNEQRPCIIREYPHGDKQKLIMVAGVENKSYLLDNPNPTDWYDEFYEKKGKKLSIGFSIYNGVDEYDSVIGIKYAKHRMKHNPFCHMESKFGGEFNNSTVEAIMDVKAKYIEEHWDEFYRPRN